MVSTNDAIPPPLGQLRLLWLDLLQSLQAWRFWFYLGWNDIAKQYRRSFMGPLWITLNTALLMVVFGMIGAQLFGLGVRDYLPYFCVGLIFFTFFSSLLNEGCQTYIVADAFLRQTPYPKLAFVLRTLWRNLIMLAHNLPVVAVVLIWAGRSGQIHWASLGAAFLVSLLAATLTIAILAALSARFRDIGMIVGAITQIGFFVTPVMWHPEQLTERAQDLILLNPLTSYLEILRRPMLGESASATSWLIALAMLPVLAAAFTLLYRHARRRIVYWL